MAVPDAWKDAIDECLSASQEDTEQVEEAERCKTSSDSEVSDDPPPVWWIRKLKTASAKVFPDAPTPDKMGLKRLISGCTGCGAEFEVFKAGFYDERNAT